MPSNESIRFPSFIKGCTDRPNGYFELNRFLTKFNIDVAWNMGSFAVMGLSGIAFNVLVGLFYDAEALGIFNQVFAVYIFFSQFATGGIHLSTLKYIAQHSDDHRTCNDIIVAAILVVFAVSLAFTFLFVFSRELIGGLLKSEGVANGILYAAPGLFLFALNKVLLAILNGFRRMRSYAVIQALRYTNILCTLAVMIMFSVSKDKIAGVFSVAELIVFVILIPGLKKHFKIARTSHMIAWLPKHLSFGAKSFMSGVLIELNTRVDVLMIGYFLSDKVVGIYSFAAIMAEGFYQLLVVLRTNYNPVLVRIIAEKRLKELKVLVKKGKILTFALMGVVGVVSVLLYPYVIQVITNKAAFEASWSVFAILMCGIVISSGYVPFNQILLQSGRPGAHTMMIATVLLANGVLNYLLIPVWQANGAALATGVSFIISSVLVIVTTKKTLSIYI